MKMSRKAVAVSFIQYIVQIYKDALLIILVIAPILCGLFFKFGIPLAQYLLEKYFSWKDIFVPYYLLFDLLLASMTPLMYSFASAYLILGEIDDGISGYLAVTPLGKRGYLFSRIGLPGIIALAVTLLILPAFHLSDMQFYVIAGVAVSSVFLGVIEAMLTVSIANNRVEGMAVAKLSGLFFIGLPAPFFIKGGIQYLLILLPSFWTAKFALEKQVLFLLPALVISFGWILLLYRKFQRKIS